MYYEIEKPLFPEYFQECASCDTVFCRPKKKRLRSIGTMTEFFQATKAKQQCCMCRGMCEDGHCPCVKAQHPCQNYCGKNNQTVCCNRDERVYDHKQMDGCSCLRSKCQKNYCACHAKGKKCSLKCKCVSCFNV